MKPSEGVVMIKISLPGQTKVKTLKQRFKDEFGLTLRIFDGRNLADDNMSLQQVRKFIGASSIQVRRNTQVGNLEDRFMVECGIKVQISGSNDGYLCNNKLTLAAALDEDSRKSHGISDELELRSDSGSIESNEKSSLLVDNRTGTVGLFEFQIKSGVVYEQEIEDDDLIELIKSLRQKIANKNYIEASKDLINASAFEFDPGQLEGGPERFFACTDLIEFPCSEENTSVKIGFDGGLTVTYSVLFELPLKHGVTLEEVKEYLPESGAWAAAHVSPGWSYMESDGDNVWLLGTKVENLSAITTHPQGTTEFKQALVKACLESGDHYERLAYMMGINAEHLDEWANELFGRSLADEHDLAGKNSSELTNYEPNTTENGKESQMMVSVDVYTKDIDAALEATKVAIKNGAISIRLQSNEDWDTKKFENLNLMFEVDHKSPAIEHLDNGPFAKNADDLKPE
jgi:transposase-like protein